MAKRSTKPAKAAEEIGSLHSGNLHSFDEHALSALTAKIEKCFGGETSPQPFGAHRGQKGGSETNGQRTTKSKSKAKPAELVRGTKRDVRGNAKEVGKEIRNRQGKPKNGKGGDDRAVLLKEILALGGTEEDLDLVADATSDDEDNDSKVAPPDKSFRKDLANFVAGLGIEGELGADQSDSNDNEDVGDDWEDTSDLNLVVSDREADVQSVSAASPLDIPSSNDPKRLVSTISARATGLTDSQ